ncbi:hypothetical protein, partial [Allofournierella sp.]|uniref:hypothetical protein n=1 Tax=Allofournierella sp. TaxID=1940256 RepID=UPI003AB78AC5
QHSIFGLYADHFGAYYRYRISSGFSHPTGFMLFKKTRSTAVRQANKKLLKSTINRDFKS